MESIFLNLPAMNPKRLEAQGGFFGWVLRLVQERKSRPERFRSQLRRAIAALEAMPPEERLRWLDLLSYVYALVYHVRGPSERPALHETIEASVRTDRHRQELFDMGKTIAEELKEEGKKEGMSEGMLRARRQTLIRQLGKRFGHVPEEISRAIEAMRDAGELDRWLDNVVTAETLSDVGVGSAG